eukprot:m.53967 g.53967  ORF g.53967 m.53967 type:complete len:267 (+) comp11379_c0_seq3:50-850(+)
MPTPDELYGAVARQAAQDSVYEYLHTPSAMHPDFALEEDEITFDPSIHLALSEPETVKFLTKDFGYTPEQLRDMNITVSDLGATTCFRVLSDEGVKAFNTVVSRLSRHARISERIPRVLRGGIFRSKFLRDLCFCPELTVHLSKMAQTQIVPHPMAIHNGHINLKPIKDPAKPVDRWHVDGTPFVMVLFATDPTTHEGGNFEFFNGTMHEGEELFKQSGSANLLQRTSCLAGVSTLLPSRTFFAFTFHRTSCLACSPCTNVSIPII